MNELHTDLLIIGGGINGTGIAADAAGRGLGVVLCEKDDLAYATSSYSTKLIHGGLRYLEQYEFKLVHKALQEREILMRKAPFLIHPIKFVLPYTQSQRPIWLIRLGLFLYDHLARRSTLPGSKKIDLSHTAEGQALQPQYPIGFTYSDCTVDDSRLVVLNALCAKKHGANILTHTECIKATRVDEKWHAVLRDKNSQETTNVICKAIINTAGPWVGAVLESIFKLPSHNHVKLVKGSHIVVPKLYEGRHGFILQNKDKRVVFAIPYLNNFTLIGTTEENFEGDPNTASITDEETLYLCNTINTYLNSTIKPNDVAWSFSGVRPLYDNATGNASSTTRDYHFEVNDADGSTPLLSVFGGKLTSFRTLAEHALKQLKPYFPNMGNPWTANAALPGGTLNGTFEEFREDLKREYPWLPAQTRQRYAAAYGTRTNDLLAGTNCLEDLGIVFGAGLYQKEIDFLIEHEWAETVEDILWRRTKLGLFLTQDQIDNLNKNFKLPQ